MHIPWRCPALRRNLWRKPALWAPWVVLLYALSVGPVMMIHLRLYGNTEESPIVQVAEVAYYPLLLLHDHTALRMPLGWYTEWCGDWVEE